jgi:serine/threonine-protein kinase
MEAAVDFDVGTVIADKYRLDRLLGRGSMGEVWAAHHQTLGEQVAVKLLVPAEEGEEAESAHAATSRFLFEAQVAARLSRKTRHIVRVTDHGEHAGVAYLVMELLEGETLQAMLARESPMRLATACTIVRQIARALEQAHRDGVAHRDLKPANVFVTHDEDGQIVAKLLDFGIARASHVHRMPGAVATAKGVVFGTPSYMSPEQARGSSTVDQRCDLWALATLAYEAVSGQMPVEGDDSDEILKNVCLGRIVPVSTRLPALERFDGFFARAFDAELARRFQTASELATAFARAAGAPLEREPSTPSALEVGVRSNPELDSSAPSWLVTRRRTVWWTTGAVAALLLLGLAVVRAVRHPAEEATVSAGSAPSATQVSPPSMPEPPLPSAVLAPSAPAIAVSTLPRARVTPPSTTVATPVAPLVPTAPTAMPTPAPAPSPPPSPPATAKDRSEVF